MTTRILNNNSNNSVTGTRFISTERRTVTVNNDDIRTLHVVSRHRPSSRERTSSNSDDDSNESSNDNNRTTTTNTVANHDSNNSSSETINTIRLSASSESQHPLTNNNYVYTISTEPLNVMRLPLNNENSSNNEITNETNTNTSSLSTIERTTTANS